MIGVFDREKLDAMVTKGWLRSQRHPDADLWIYNYTEKTQFESYWTPLTIQCRGLILDADGAVAARPFPKFFNYGDPQVGTLPKEPYRTTEKIDGSLGIYYLLDGVGQIATRGSFVSDQARVATEMLTEYRLQVNATDTPLFEIVYPENRIVVDYRDRRELVLLAVLDKATGAESYANWSGPVVDRHDYLELEDIAKQERENHEGYVVAFMSGLRVKFKHREYVRLHKLITGVNARHIWEILKEGGDLDSMLAGVPDELYAWVDSTRSDLLSEYRELSTIAYEIFQARPKTSDRKLVAEYFKATGAVNPAVLFRMLDGKPYDDLIWKAIKPEPTTPDTIWTRVSA